MKRLDLSLETVSEVLITFLICIVLALFAAVKAVIVTGCTQVYILEDAGICEGGLKTLRPKNPGILYIYTYVHICTYTGMK